MADLEDERRNLTRLLRFVGGFLAWPALTVAFAFWVFEGWSTHWLHIAGLLPVGIAGLVLLFGAPRFAARYTPRNP